RPVRARAQSWLAPDEIDRLPSHLQAYDWCGRFERGAKDGEPDTIRHECREDHIDRRRLARIDPGPGPCGRRWTRPRRAERVPRRARLLRIGYAPVRKRGLC